MMSALSRALVKLYEEVEKPEDPIAFVRQHFRLNEQVGNDETTVESGNIKRLESELGSAKNEVNALRIELERLQNEVYVFALIFGLEKNSKLPCACFQELHQTGEIETK